MYSTVKVIYSPSLLGTEEAPRVWDFQCQNWEYPRTIGTSIPPLIKSDFYIIRLEQDLKAVHFMTETSIESTVALPYLQLHGHFSVNI